jgi:hypothetical protein
MEMRTSSFTLTAFAAAVFLVAGTLTPAVAQQGQPQAPGQQQQPPSPPAPYKAVAIKAPQPVKDPSFEAFRKQLGALAQKKDRTGLARLVAQNFFWIPEEKDVADRRRPGIENLSKALGLDGRDAEGWDVLAAQALETTADPHPDRRNVICAPGEPTFDEQAAEDLANATQTDPSEWGYPSASGIEVRAGPEKTSPVIERLGLHLIRAYPDDSPAAAVHTEVLRIVTPSGKLGYIPQETLLPLASDQVCYVKEGNAWKITGVLGGMIPAR